MPEYESDWGTFVTTAAFTTTPVCMDHRWKIVWEPDDDYEGGQSPAARECVKCGQHQRLGDMDAFSDGESW